MGMAKYDRLLYILNLLRARRNLNAAKLADECGVTERSIYRDIIALSEANVPIYYDNGYKLTTDNFLPPLNFDFEEYTCLKLSIESSPLRKTGKYEAALKRVRAKIEAGLSEVVKERRRRSSPATHIDIPVSQEESRAEKFFAPLEEAVSANRCLELEYDSIRSGPVTRVVEPYFIVFRARAFYFVAYCRLRQDFRTFRLDRIISLKPLSEQFTPRKGVSAESYFAGSWQVYSGDAVEVVIRFTGSAARVVLTGHHHPDEQIEDVNDHEIIYRVTVRGLEEIQRWILGFGADAEVVSPPELRKSIARIAGSLAIVYKSDSK
ncbi:MAG TPA: YafY family protein [Candidatus Acidoferrum sp.]|nr:YafY family protein [Candidatus Acidoferrum sp.]